MDVFVARQPIFDRDRNVFGYELLYRNSMTNSFDPSVGSTEATTRLLNNSYITIGIQNLTENKMAFVNFDENLILNQVALMLDKRKVIVEILEDVLPSPELLTELTYLKKMGYILALDDFTIDYPHDSILHLCDIIKVDFGQTNIVKARKILEKYQDTQKKFLAEKIENEAVYKLAHAMGYDYFQGYYFSKPVIIKGKGTKSLKMQYARVKSELNRPDPDFSKIASIIESDIDMSYKLLRMVNSFALLSKMTSIRHALAYMGIDEIKKWLNFVIIQELIDEKTAELVRISVLRSKFAELIADQTSHRMKKYEASLAGLFSMIDILIEKPFAEILSDLPISDEVKEAITGEKKNFLYHVLQVTIFYEKGDWDQMNSYFDSLGIEENLLPDLYFEAVKWTDDFMQIVRDS